MVFNPTSPIRAFGRKPVVVPRTATPSSEVVTAEKESTTMSPSDIPRSSTPLRGWREGVSRLMRQSQERHPPPQEVSRWSKTTTESEASEALQAPVPSKTNVLKKKTKQDRRSKDTANSSPVDPSYDPVTKTLRPIGDTALPPVPVTGPDEPQSFYDSSSDESSHNGPVIHRASSVRVARPHIVQHSNASGGSVPKLYPLHSSTLDEEPLPVEPSAARGTELKKLQDMAASAERRQQKNVSGTPADALKALEGQDTNQETASASMAAEETASPKQTNRVKETILEFPDTPGKLEALDTLPTPMGGFGSLRMPSITTNTDSTYSSSTYVSPSAIDGLRSNPITGTDLKLSRAISAPVRNPARRVMIRPADLVIKRTNNDAKLFRESIVSTPYPARHSSIGEIEETETKAEESRTPRSLRRAKPLSRSPREKSNSSKEETYTDAQEKSEKTPPEIPLSTKPLPSAPITSRSDRFPSPVAPEILFLDLRLARHPSARVSVQIEVTDKTTFDDEALFTLIRETYNGKLLGVVRRFFTARTLSYASLASTSSTAIAPSAGTAGLRGFGLGLGYWHGQQSTTVEDAPEIDGADFVKHLLHPRHGRRRKMWLLWLRNNQDSGDSLARRSRLVSSSSSSPQGPESPVFSFIHSRTGSSGAGVGGGSVVGGTGMGTGSVGTVGTGGVGNSGNGINNLPDILDTNTSTMPTPSLSAKPSIRLPFQPVPAPYRSKSLATRSRHGGHSHSHPGPPSLYLHHIFSLRKVVGMLCLTFLMAVFAAIMWILFGVPGRGADQGNGTTEVEGKEYTLSWRRDAQGRVGIGLVLGIVVLAFGLVTEAVWVWASWVLL